MEEITKTNELVTSTGLFSTSPAIQMATKGNVNVVTAYTLQDAIRDGEIPGAVTATKFGRVQTLTTAQVPADIWPIAATNPVIPLKTVGATISIASDNVNDTLLGTGAQKVRLVGVDGDWNLASETIELDGTTPVVTSLSWIALNHMLVEEVGSDVSQTNLGNLTFTHTGDIVGYISADMGQSAHLLLTVPDNYTCRITGPFMGIIKSGTGKTMAARMQVKEFGKAWRTVNFAEATSSGTSYVRVPPSEHFTAQLSGKSRIKGNVFTISSTGTGAFGGFAYTMWPNGAI